MNGAYRRRDVLGGIATGSALAAAPAMGQALGKSEQRGIGLSLPRVEWRTSPVGIDTLRPRFTWQIETGETARGVLQSAAHIVVASTEAMAAAGRGDVWDGGRTAGARPAARPSAPLRLASHTSYWWSVMLWDGEGRASSWSGPERFVTGILTPSEWQARWIAAKPDPPAPPPHIRGMSKAVATDTRLPLMRRGFDLDALPVRAFVSVVGLGQFELRVNGRPVTESLLNPGWTDYRKTILYDSYDVTPLLVRGENMLAAMLGNGMYNVEKVPGRYTKFVDSFGQPKLLLQLTLVEADGRVRTIVSDESWRTAPSPITFSSIYGGEDADARLAMPGWDRPGASSRGWSRVVPVSGPGGRLRAQMVPPVVTARTLQPVKVTQPRPGIWVYDFGENVAAQPELVVRGAAGATVTLTPGEAIDAEGLVSQRSFNARPNFAVLFRYTLAGRGEERFRPRFSYQGFRYLQVEGAAPAEMAAAGQDAAIVSLVSHVIHADVPRTGSFESSDTLFVRIHHLIDRALSSNMMSVLTDCPHREKLGWLEQTYLNASTVFYNRDAITLYEKLVGDIADAQQADGMVPGIAPEYVAFVNPDGSDMIYRNSPEWGIAAVLSPWAAYRAYGDTVVLERGYPAMRRYLAYLGTRAVGGILDFGMGDWYDVGPKAPGPAQLTSRALTGTLVYYEGLRAAARIARLIRRPAGEAADYSARASAVARAFAARFAGGDGLYDTGSQTAQAMPLALGLVPAAERARALERLVGAIRASGNGVTAGDVGFHYVVEALQNGGRNDVMFDMMSVTDRPSYGWQLAHGATALTEAWDADPTKSLDHFMLGHGEGWLYGALAGLKVDFAAPEEARIVTVAPHPVGAIGSVTASYRSVLGLVASDWTRRPGAIALGVTIPAGAVATVRVPTSRPDAVVEGGGPAARAAGVRSARATDGGLELVVGSGRYRFVAPA